MRAIGADLTRHTPVDAGAILASETRHAVVGIAAAGLETQAAKDLWIADVGGVAAVGIVVACAAAGHEAAREIPAAGGQTNLARAARVLIITKQLGIGA